MSTTSRHEVVHELWGPVLVPGRQVPSLSWTAQYPDQVDRPTPPISAGVFTPPDVEGVRVAWQGAYPAAVPRPASPDAPSLFAPPRVDAAPVVDIWAGTYPALLDDPVVLLPAEPWAGGQADAETASGLPPETVLLWPEDRTWAYPAVFRPSDTPAPAPVPDQWAGAYPEAVREVRALDPGWMGPVLPPPPAPVVPDQWAAYYPVWIDVLPITPPGLPAYPFGATIPVAGLLFRRTLQMRIGGRTALTEL